MWTSTGGTAILQGASAGEVSLLQSRCACTRDGCGERIDIQRKRILSYRLRQEQRQEIFVVIGKERQIRKRLQRSNTRCEAGAIAFQTSLVPFRQQKRVTIKKVPRRVPRNLIHLDALLVIVMLHFFLRCRLRYRLALHLLAAHT